MEKVTLLIPNYNNAAYLEDCLKSIQKQTYTDFKILIVDDGSTDNSVEIIEQFPDNRIQLIQKEKNSGIVDTLNVGLEAISSEYMMRMDGDDLMTENRIEKLVQFLDRNPDFGICGSGIQQFGLSDKKMIYETNPLKNRANLIFGHSIGHASCIFRMDTIKQHNIRYSNGYKYLEDYKIFYDLSQVTKMTSIPDLLYLYRQEDYNQESVYASTKKTGFLKIYCEILSLLHFQSPEQSAVLHYELNKNVPCSFSKKDYKNHLKQLISQNKTYTIFPKKELKQKLSDIYTVLFYRLVDQKKLSFIESLSFIALSPKKLYYFINSKRTHGKTR